MNFINVYNKMDRRITKCDRSGVNMNKKENIMKKKLTAILLAAAMAVTGLFTAMTPEKANARGFLEPNLDGFSIFSFLSFAK